MPYITHIEQATRENSFFRKVLYTAKHSQLVLMSVKPGEEIGVEKHKVDQFIRIEEGFATVTLDGRETRLAAEDALVIPAGTVHNVVNTGKEDLKLYTVYSPPNHIDGTIHKTKADAEADKADEKFGHRQNGGK